MIATPPSPSVADPDLAPVPSATARRLVATEYSRHQLAAAIHESFVEALHVRLCELSAIERAWLRDWLTTAVPRLTEQTVDALAAQLEAGLWSAPSELVASLADRRRRADLGVE